jgi:hypothetical protein
VQEWTGAEWVTIGPAPSAIEELPDAPYAAVDINGQIVTPEPALAGGSRLLLALGITGLLGALMVRGRRPGGARD